MYHAQTDTPPAVVGRSEVSCADFVLWLGSEVVVTEGRGVKSWANDFHGKNHFDSAKNGYAHIGDRVTAMLVVFVLATVPVDVCWHRNRIMPRGKLR